MKSDFEILNNILKQKGLTFAVLSRKTGLSTSLFTNLKSGRQKGLTLETARKICLALNISLDEFR